MIQTEVTQKPPQFTISDRPQKVLGENGLKYAVIIPIIAPIQQIIIFD